MTLSSISIPRNTLLVLVCLLSLLGGLQINAQQPAAPPQPQAIQQQPQQQPAPTAADDDVERPLSSDGAPSVALFYWLTPAKPAMGTGKAAAVDTSANLTYPRKQVYAPAAMISLPAGKLHTLRLSYFRTRGQGNTNAGENLAIFGVGYAPGDYLSVGYNIENAKLSLDYLSWPFPVRSSQRFRVKTLWEVQYTSISTRLDAPLKPKQDANGDPVFYDGKGKSWFIYPTLGMGVQHLVTKHFRWEAQGSGFGLPGRAAIWDADAHLAYRAGKIEMLVGAKAFHFKTSPKQELFVKSTLSGGYVGLRWYP